MAVCAGTLAIIAAAAPATPGACLDFARADLVEMGFGAMHGVPNDTRSVQESCRKLLKEGGGAPARLQLARAQIAAAAFADADSNLGEGDMADSGEALRLRGFLRDLSLVGGSRDFPGAQAFYDRAIAKGDVVALDMRARGLTEAAEDQGQAVPPTAAVLLERAVAAGYAPAMNDLAALIENGGVPGKTAQDAASLLERASDAGLAAAKVRLSTYYARGYGVQKDLAKALALGRDAAAGSPVLLNPPVGFGDGLRR